jgi:hypothetical protein
MIDLEGLMDADKSHREAADFARQEREAEHSP